MAQIVYETRDESSQYLSAAPCTFSSDLSLVILPRHLKFWKRSVEFSFYLILFGKHTIILNNNQWNLGRFAVKARNKKKGQDQAD